VAKGGFEAVDLAVNQITQNLTRAMAQSSKRTLKLAGKNLQNITRLYKEQAENKSSIVKVNQGIASLMQEAVVEAYGTNVVAVRSAPSYRRGDRYAGRLLNALRDPSMAVGTADGIEFINTALLDSKARQWARLNFGAGPATGAARGSGPFPQPNARIQFGSNQGISLRLNNPPRPNFRVPVGYFDTEGRFYLAKKKTRWIKAPKGSETVGGYPSAPFSKGGIAPRRFLDAGLVALGQNFGREYRVHFQQVAEQVKAKAGSRTVIS
jgi:hypothetical protein